MSANKADDVDPFFARAEDSEWNACIGIQGSEQNYIDGFIESAIELSTALIDKALYGKVDTLVLPILYNARHGVELCLKFVISRLRNAGVTISDHPKNHDIKRQWSSLASSQVGDSDLRNLVKSLRPFVESLHNVDEDGQQLRYHETRSGHQSLSDKSICNLVIVRDSLLELGKILMAMKRRAVEFADEQATGSYTPQCSRRDLARIAKVMPNKSNWSEPEFDAAKSRVLEDFNLSNTSFSKALSRIECHRELGSLLGVEFSLAHLTDEHTIFAIRAWSTVYPRDGDVGGSVSLFAVDFDKMKAHGKLKAEAVDSVLGVLSLDEVADLYTIFYVGRERMYCEYYSVQLESARAEMRNAEAARARFSHVFSKKNFLEELANGLEILGRRRLASELRATRPDLFVR